MNLGHLNAEVEWELASEVQAGLFPRKKPKLDTLNYAGLTLPAGPLGGDYFDFLDLGRGYLGLAVGDIAGKGIASALLMASLQAILRSQCLLALDDIGSLLRSVNRVFCEDTPDASYATLFFAEYWDREQRLRYVNCGHPPALVLRSSGAIERLEPSATVLGIWEEWDCTIEEVRLAANDTFILFTDGVTEARDDHDEEFGEERLADLARAGRGLPVSDLSHFILEGVRNFAGPRPQHDDITVVSARCRGK